MGVDLSGNGKWVGGTVGANGNIYFMPRNIADILEIDTFSSTASLIAMPGSNETSKWQGCTLDHNGNIYSCPYSSSSILIISKNIDVPIMGLKTAISPHLNKM